MVDRTLPCDYLYGELNPGCVNAALMGGFSIHGLLSKTSDLINNLIYDKATPKTLASGVSEFRAVVLHVDEVSSQAWTTNPNLGKIYPEKRAVQSEKRFTSFWARIPELDLAIPCPEVYGDQLNQIDPEPAAIALARIQMHTVYKAMSDDLQVPSPGDIVWVSFGNVTNRMDARYKRIFLSTGYSGGGAAASSASRPFNAPSDAPGELGDADADANDPEPDPDPDPDPDRKKPGTADWDGTGFDFRDSKGRVRDDQGRLKIPKKKKDATHAVEPTSGKYIAKCLVSDQKNTVEYSETINNMLVAKWKPIKDPLPITYKGADAFYPRAKIKVTHIPEKPNIGTVIIPTRTSIKWLKKYAIKGKGCRYLAARFSSGKNLCLRFHYGEDLFVEPGSIIYAPIAGTVSRKDYVVYKNSKWDYGRGITITNGKLRVRIFHLVWAPNWSFHEILTPKAPIKDPLGAFQKGDRPWIDLTKLLGKKVEAGQPIGFSYVPDGNTYSISGKGVQKRTGEEIIRDRCLEIPDTFKFVGDNGDPLTISEIINKNEKPKRCLNLIKEKKFKDTSSHVHIDTIWGQGAKGNVHPAHMIDLERLTRVKGPRQGPSPEGQGEGVEWEQDAGQPPSTVPTGVEDGYTSPDPPPDYSSKTRDELIFICGDLYEKWKGLEAKFEAEKAENVIDVALGKEAKKAHDEFKRCKERINNNGM